MSTVEGSSKTVAQPITRVHYIGAYPPDYARHRVIQSGLQELGIAVNEKIDRSFLPVRWWRLRTELHKLPKDGPLIVGEAGNYMSPVLLEARRLGLPLVFDPFVSLCGVAEDRQVGWRRTVLASLGAMIDRINDWAAGALLFDTPQTRSYFVERLGLASEKAFVAYVGAELSVFQLRQRSINESGPYRVLFYGTFIPLHGVDVIIRAAAEVQKATNHVRFQLVGSGQTRDEMQVLARELGLRNVYFGPASVSYFDLPDLIAQADVSLGIFANRPKTRMVIPHKLFQCAAMGVPVITADTPAIRDAFAPGELALVPAGDPQALAEMVLDLVADAERRTRLGQQGSDAVRTRYSPRVITSQVLAACHAVYDNH